MKLMCTRIGLWTISIISLAPGPYHPMGRCQHRPSQRDISTYTFTYLGLPVAQGSIIVYDSTDTDHSFTIVRTRATSSSPTSLLFKIDNTYTTTLDPKTGYPLTYEKSIIQSNLEEHRIFRFDPDQGIIFRDDEPLTAHPHPVHNIFSALHGIINHTFEAKETLTLSVHAAGRLWQVKVEAIRMEKVTTPIGSSPAVLLEIEFCPSTSEDTVHIDTDVLTNRLIRGGEKTRLWISQGKEQSLVKAEYALYPTSLHMVLSGRGQ